MKAKPQWTLVVEGLGKIKHAEVRVRPLTLFVGENNTGKSYLASLLWGLYSGMDSSLWPNLFEEEKSHSVPSYLKVIQWFEQHIAKDKEARFVTYEFVDDDYQLFIDWYKDVITMNKSKIVQYIFNNKKIDVSDIQIKDYSPTFPVGLKLTLFRRETLKQSRFITAFSVPIQSLFGFASPIFLPASRTGFMLLYKAVVRRQINKISVFETQEKNEIELPFPALQFLQLLATDLKDTIGPYSAEADYLEESIQGKIELKSGLGLNEFYYKTPSSQNPVPMALASSLVTELAPIILVLRHMQSIPILIIEEPEAHLHPAVQRRLAVVIARLIRKGVSVWITTHSENFCQQINNLIKLGAHPQRERLQKELGYLDSDYLLPEEVAGYQLTNQGDYSEVKEIESTEQGLTMPTFNETLMALVKETMALQQKAEDSE